MSILNGSSLKAQLDVKSSQTRQVVNRAATAFRLAAQAVSRSQTALGAFYRRICSRLGAPKAITATAHKIPRLYYTAINLSRDILAVRRCQVSGVRC